MTVGGRILNGERGRETAVYMYVAHHTDSIHAAAFLSCVAGIKYHMNYMYFSHFLHILLHVINIHDCTSTIEGARSRVVSPKKFSHVSH